MRLRRSSERDVHNAVCGERVVAVRSTMLADSPGPTVAAALLLMIPVGSLALGVCPNATHKAPTRKDANPKVHASGAFPINWPGTLQGSQVSADTNDLNMHQRASNDSEIAYSIIASPYRRFALRAVGPHSPRSLPASNGKRAVNRQPGSRSSDS